MHCLRYKSDKQVHAFHFKEKQIDDRDMMSAARAKKFKDGGGLS